MNRYYFSYRLSGKDIRGVEITPGLAVYRMDIEASTRAIAEKKLKALYVKSVELIDITYTVLPNIDK